MPTLSVKVSDEFLAALDKAAEAAGQSRSEYVRAAAQDRVRPPVGYTVTGSGPLVAPPSIERPTFWKRKKS